MLVAPSPKSHWNVSAFSDWLVNCTSRGAWPLTVLTVNCASGGLAQAESADMDASVIAKNRNVFIASLETLTTYKQ